MKMVQAKLLRIICILSTQNKSLAHKVVLCNAMAGLVLVNILL